MSRTASPTQSQTPASRQIEPAVAFKIESPNHPSAVQPYQEGSAGVGDTLCGVFTTGAPIAALDSIRFDPLSSPCMRHLFAGVVKGIGPDGNRVGVLNIGGETYFEGEYAGKPLVNAMQIGVLKHDDLIKGVLQESATRSSVWRTQPSWLQPCINRRKHRNMSSLCRILCQ